MATKVVLSLLTVCFSFFLTSCDVEHLKEYYVINNYNDSIAFSYKINNDNLSVNELIRMGDTLLIYSHSYVFGTVGIDDDRERLSISDLTIDYNGDIVTIDKNDWTYQEIGKYYARYHLMIDSLLFK